MGTRTMSSYSIEAGTEAGHHLAKARILHHLALGESMRGEKGHTES